jgi:uncharacterized RDD family membrane protein YckC
MTNWHYLEDGVVRGPAPHTEMLELFREQRLPAGTLVWKEGMEDWRPAGDMGLLPPAPPPVGPREEAGPPPVPAQPVIAVEDPPARPIVGELAWRRYFARLFDFVLFAMFFAVALAAVNPEWAQSIADSEQMLLGMLAVFAYVPFEALLLSSSGSTPGKRLFALRVRTLDGSPLDFGRALQRSLRLYVYGQALGVPLLTWLAKALALERFRRTGTTIWDEQCGTEVEYAPMSPNRRLFAGMLVAGYLALMVSMLMTKMGG